jgi:lysozyme
MNGINESMLLNQLKQQEGLNLKMYKDTVNVWTIGYGTNLEQGIDIETAEWLLKHELEKKLNELENIDWFKNLDEVRQAVIANMSFNIGTGGVLKFQNMIACIIKKDWNGAAANMLNSLWASQVKGRANELAEQMQTGFFKNSI